MRSKFIIFFIIILSILNAEDRYKSFSTWVKSVPEYGYDGMKYSFTQKSDLLILGTAGLGVLLATQFDDNVKDYAQREGLLPEKVSQIGDLYGVEWSVWLLPASIIISSKIGDDTDREMMEKLEFATSAMVANAATTFILKKLIGRQRPNGENNFSMPSGHSSQSFTVAAVANELYGTTIGTAAYLMSGIVALSRINDNKHYLSDVIAGAVLGTLIGRGFAQTYNKYHLSGLETNGYSLSFNYYFK